MGSQQWRVTLLQSTQTDAMDSLKGATLIKADGSKVEADKALEIVFVSSDRSPEDMISYMKESHGDWCGVEHNSALANELKQKYGVQGIPMLVVVKKDGTVVTKDGRSNVVGKQPKQAVQGWKA